MVITLDARERELKKRFEHPHDWAQRQLNEWDAITGFVYHIFSFEALVKEMETRFGLASNYKELLGYAMNRWYNFWAAKAVEQIFCSHPAVTAASDTSDRLREFRIGNLTFDHKTSTYPRGFNHDLDYGQKHPRELIEWFYTHQSQQRKKRFENRIFIVLYASDGQHWKLKAELSWLEGIITEYLDKASEERFLRFKFEGARETAADVLWAVR